jgi:hypothetical protein
VRHGYTHSHPIGIENGSPVLVALDDPIDQIEPLELTGATQAERDAAMKALFWVVDMIGGAGICAKVIALRYLMRLETRPMEQVAKPFGLGRAAISKHVTDFATAFGVTSFRSQSARQAYSETQREVWKTRPRKHKNAVNGQENF